MESCYVMESFCGTVDGELLCNGITGELSCNGIE